YLDLGGTLLLVSHSMYHVQTLCRKAMWIDHGRARLFGDSFDVTREYLTYHEEKRRAQSQAERAPAGGTPRLLSLDIERASLRQGDELVARAEAYEPDGRAPVLLFGIVRADGSPVYGSHSNEGGFAPTPVGELRFAFGVRFPRVTLLPGKYMMR